MNNEGIKAAQKKESGIFVWVKIIKKTATAQPPAQTMGLKDQETVRIVPRIVTSASTTTPFEAKTVRIVRNFTVNHEQSAQANDEFIVLPENKDKMQIQFHPNHTSYGDEFAIEAIMLPPDFTREMAMNWHKTDGQSWCADKSPIAAFLASQMYESEHAALKAGADS